MHDLDILATAPKVKAVVQAIHFAMEKLYGHVIHCRKSFELRAEDLPISTLSFLKICTDPANDKENITKVMRDLELIIKSHSDGIIKIKSIML